MAVNRKEAFGEAFFKKAFENAACLKTEGSRELLFLVVRVSKTGTTRAIPHRV
ncbi:hypothetical protein [Komagataeibacter sp. FXV3]|uniref:hypothetical protein n=1 Tax=Komagataeibacter sp. FXV3 TaxID=2608998 RepID=UPI00187B802B|nr:hypothetical protein [Komagataeibacter sp. FXV3]